MEQRNLTTRLAVLIVIACALVLTGCGKKGTTTVNPKAFDQAPPDVKQFWDAAQAADKTNNYAAGQTLYYSLLRQNITPEQKQAVTEALTGLTDRFNKALDAGDPAAQEALKELRRNPPNRPH